MSTRRNFGMKAPRPDKSLKRSILRVSRIAKGQAVALPDPLPPGTFVPPMDGLDAGIPCDGNGNESP